MDASVVSRRVALDILVSCLDKGQPLDDALARHQGFAGLDPRDRAFVRLLLATTLRRLGEIDEVLGFLIERPLDGANAAGTAMSLVVVARKARARWEQRSLSQG